MDRSSKIVIVSLVLALVVAAIITWYIVENRAQQNSEANQIFSEEQSAGRYTSLDGQPVSVASYIGTPLVVLSWASWCPQCSGELEKLNAIAATYSDRDIAFLAINRKESKVVAERYLRTLPEFSELEFVIDLDDHFFNSTAGYAMPELVIFDREGNRIEHIRGEFNADNLTTILSDLSSL